MSYDAKAKNAYLSAKYRCNVNFQELQRRIEYFNAEAQLTQISMNSGQLWVEQANFVHSLSQNSDTLNRWNSVFHDISGKQMTQFTNYKYSQEEKIKKC